MTNYDSQTIHEKLIEAINKVHGRQVFKVRKKPISLSNPSQFKDLDGDIHKAVALSAQTLNFTGGSVSDIDIYTLLRKYICDDSIREKINEII